MNTEDTIFDNEKTQYDDSQVNSTVEGQTNNEVENNDDNKKSKGSTWRKVGTGLGMGILLGSTTSFVTSSAFANDGENVNDGEDIQGEAAQGTNTQATYQEDHPWADTEIQVASNVNDDMSFSEAFAAARAEVGPGGAFEWHGNVYGTYTAEEWDNLSVEQREEYNEHFNWNNHTTSETTNTTSNDNVEVVAAEDNNVAGTSHTTTESNVDVEVEVVDSDPEVQIHGVVHDDETGANLGAMVVDDQEVVLIDVDGEGTFDYMASDLNHDGELTDNEIADISNEQLSVAQFEDQSFGNDTMYASTDGTTDYINDDSNDYGMA